MKTEKVLVVTFQDIMLLKSLGRCLLWSQHWQKGTSKAHSGLKMLLMSTLPTLKMSNWTPYGLVDLKDTTKPQVHINLHLWAGGDTQTNTVMFYVYTFLGDQPLLQLHAY